MRKINHNNLKLIALLIYLIGAIVLLLKGFSLLNEASLLKPEESTHIKAGFAAFSLGLLKAVFLFSKSSRRNLVRIDALKNPKIWQFFSPGFFVALAIMISTGVTLSRMAHGSYPFLIGVGILDMGIGVALLGSSWVFWQEKVFLK